MLARIAAVKAAAAAGQTGARELARTNQWTAWAKAEGHDVVGLACFALEASHYYEYVLSASNWSDEISREGLEG